MFCLELSPLYFPFYHFSLLINLVLNIFIYTAAEICDLLDMNTQFACYMCIIYALQVSMSKQ